MKSFILQKDKLNDFLGAIEDHDVWAPVRKEGAVVLERVEDFENISLDLTHQIVNTKQVVFPQSEPLFTFKKGGAPEVPDTSEQKGSVVFGIRPCDGRALSLIDPVFEADPQDPYYLDKRAKTILMGIACNDPFAHCFCPSVGGAPASTQGLDVLFTELSDGYFIEVISEKGVKFMEANQGLLSPASDKDAEEKTSLAQAALEKIQRKIDLDSMPEKLAAVFDHDIWKTLSRKCTRCGICTYTCPTCFCFDIQDEVVGDRGRRMRIWDSCMFGEYTLHASGHNPRPTRSERIRNRLCHKFKYNMDHYGVPSCVGCGRCTALCPVNVDLIENLAAIKEVE